MLTILVLLSVIFAIAMAAISKAKMDTVKDHYGTSIYTHAMYVKQWFDPTVSWHNKNSGLETKDIAKWYLPSWAFWIWMKKPGWDPLSDFWHWEQTKCGFFLLALMPTMNALLIYIIKERADIIAILIIILLPLVLGITWTLVFNYWYNRKLPLPSYKKKWLWLKGSTQV